MPGRMTPTYPAVTQPQVLGTTQARYPVQTSPSYRPPVTPAPTMNPGLMTGGIRPRYTASPTGSAVGVTPRYHGPRVTPSFTMVNPYSRTSYPTGRRP